MVVLQECTDTLLTHLVQVCDLICAEVVGGMLQLGRGLGWRLHNRPILRVGSALVSRMVEAADLGHFSGPDSLLSGLAATLVNRVMFGQGALR